MLSTLYKLSTLMGCAFLFASSQAAAFQETLAWSRFLNTNISGQTLSETAVDNAGDAYVLYSAQQNSAATLNLAKYDLSGNLTLFKPISLGITPVAEGVFVSPVSNGGQQDIYILAEYQDTQKKTYTYVSRFTSAGAQVWYHTFTGAGGFAGPVGFDMDSAGNSYLALETAFTNQLAELEMIKFSANGTIVSNVANTNIDPVSATHQNGFWIAYGYDNVVTQVESSRWGIYSDSTGQAVNSFAITQTSSHGVTSQFFYTAIPKANGTIYVIEQENDYDDSSGDLIDNAFKLGSYTSGGQFSSATPWNEGYGYDVETGGSTVYVLSQSPTDSNTFIVSKLTNQALQQFTTVHNVSALFGLSVQADATGLYELYTDAGTHTLLHAVRISTAGATLWSNTLQGTGSGASAFTFAVNGKDLYTLANIPSGAGNQVVLRRYVNGVALSQLSSAPSVAANSSIMVKVQLNAPAPAGGIAVKLSSSNAHLLFSNNTTSFTVAIPAGSIYANVAMHATAVTANTAVVVTGNENGVVRQETIVVAK
jgi:hypothetical protein